MTDRTERETLARIDAELRGLQATVDAGFAGIREALAAHRLDAKEAEESLGRRITSTQKKAAAIEERVRKIELQIAERRGRDLALTAGGGVGGASLIGLILWALQAFSGGAAKSAEPPAIPPAMAAPEVEP